MIKINLLGSPKPKRGKRAATAVTEMGDMGGSAGPNPIMLIVIAIVIGAGVSGFMWMQANNKAAEIAKNMKQAETENRRLSAVKAKSLRFSVSACFMFLAI